MRSLLHQYAEGLHCAKPLLSHWQRGGSDAMVPRDVRPALARTLSAGLVVLVLAGLWVPVARPPEAHFRGKPTRYWRGQIREYLDAQTFDPSPDWLRRL